MRLESLSRELHCHEDRILKPLALGTFTRYRPLKAPESIPPKRKGPASSSAYEPQVELVTVPAMGAEWSAQELADMKKSTKRDQAAEERKRVLREFARDQRGLCGVPFLTRTWLVYILFFTVIV